LAVVDMDACAGSAPHMLSGGQKRRVAIAGVLAMQPTTLVLDEPAAGLDPAGRREMLALLRNLHARGGMTLVMVSHSMNDVAQLCSRVLVMNKGTLAMDGTPGEVFQNGKALTEMGLGLPRAAQLANALAQAGFPMPSGLWRLEDVERAIVRGIKGDAVNG
ncbi:MAG: ATP-binding cassette domain-containing protein, partial [Clostridia bacterium]